MIALVLAAAAVHSAAAQSAQPLPRDTTVARRLDSLAAVLRVPITLPTVPAFPSAGAVKQRTDTVRYLMRSSTSCNVSSCRARVTRLQFEIDSLVARPPAPDLTAPVPVPPPTTPPPDTQPTPTPAPPPTTSTVELPRTFLNFVYPARTGQTIVVPAGGNLQGALNTAQRGDEIVLTAGATFTGNYILPAKAGTSANGWITIRTDQSAQLPPIGTRVGAQHASLMPKLITANSEPALRTAAAACGWWVSGLEITVAPAWTQRQYGIVWLGELGGGQTSLATVPCDLVLDRSYVHGQTTTFTSRCVALHSARTQITDSRLLECHDQGFDSQAIFGANGPGPYKIVNNDLQGAGENVMFGGVDNPGIPGVVPSDIELRKNHFLTPIAWKGVWTKKNLFEIKNGARILVEGNVFEGSWLDAQTGWAMILRDDGCAWCFARDITIRRNLIRNVGAGINIADPINRGATRFHIAENVLDSVASGVYGIGADRRAIQVLAGVAGVTLERNLITGTVHTAALLPEGGAPCVIKENVWATGVYGVIGSGYAPGITSIAGGCGATYVWSGMTMIGQSFGNPYPAGTTWVTSESQAPLAAQIRAFVQQATAGVKPPN